MITKVGEKYGCFTLFQTTFEANIEAFNEIQGN